MSILLSHSYWPERFVAAPMLDPRLHRHFSQTPASENGRLKRQRLVVYQSSPQGWVAVAIVA